MRRLVRDLRARRSRSAMASAAAAVRGGRDPQDGQAAVAARDLPSGHVLAADDLAAKSPADGGLPPYELERMLGRQLRRSLGLEESVAFEDLEPVEAPLATPGGAAER